MTVEGLAIDQDAPAVGAIEAGDQVQQGAFAAAGLAHQRQAAALGQLQVDALQNR
ncbi:hypothetical protein D3C76_1789850 [compost metagenome]